MQNDPRYSQARQLHQSMMNRHPGPPGQECQLDHIQVHQTAIHQLQDRVQIQTIELTFKIRKCFNYELKLWHIVFLHVISPYHLKLLWLYKANVLNKEVLPEAIKHHTQDKEVDQQEPLDHLILKHLRHNQYHQFQELGQVNLVLEE